MGLGTSAYSGWGLLIRSRFGQDLIFFAERRAHHFTSDSSCVGASGHPLLIAGIQGGRHTNTLQVQYRISKL